MKTHTTWRATLRRCPLLLVLATLITSALAQEVSIPDPELNDAIRATLQKPTGPLTQQDLLSLTTLEACCRGVRSIEGLEAARNLTRVFLDRNQLTDFTLSTTWTNLSVLDLSFNALTNVSLPNRLTNLTRLLIQGNLLTQIHLPDDLTRLTRLDLDDNRLTNITLPAALTSLIDLDLAENQLTTLLLPAGLTNLQGLFLFSNQLTNLTLPPDVASLRTINLALNQLTALTLPARLTNLQAVSAFSNQLTTMRLPPGLTSLSTLELGRNRLSSLALSGDLSRLLSLSLLGNRFTNITFPPGMTNLNALVLDGNHLTSLTLPPDMTALAALHARGNQLTDVAFAPDMTNLFLIDLTANAMTNLTFPDTLTQLRVLDLASNRLTNLKLPSPMDRLFRCTLPGNQLTNITFPVGLSELNDIDLRGNQLRSFTLPAGLTNLHFLHLDQNQLTNLNLPPDLKQLSILGLAGNQLTGLKLPGGMTNLAAIFISNNQLTNVTLAPDSTELVFVDLAGNPLSTFVLSEPLAATNLANMVASLRNQGVSVFVYPLTTQLVSPHATVDGAFEFALTGPPGLYTVMSSADLSAWSVRGTVTNTLGNITFTDVQANLSPRQFYRAVMQSPPRDMVFIPANTFTMGSPPTELHRSSDEGPQTTVVLSRGFWIGKYEMTQGEYLSVMNTNPSIFPGDLSRPVSSVTWLDATNYCAKLTQRELAAGRIPVGSEYRLPTEAEWECAARAGTTTRFSYGDDPTYASLTNHAWLHSNAGLMVHPVGQKLPNPWGLYDMTGNVWEWCLDWYGPLPGGVQTDPTGPPPNPIGWKVMRGGAYDFTEPDCRSARRLFFPATPFHTDSDLGFRIVLVTAQ